jgi:hypothetical protein
MRLFNLRLIYVFGLEIFPSPHNRYGHTPSGAPQRVVCSSSESLTGVPLCLELRGLATICKVDALSSAQSLGRLFGFVLLFERIDLLLLSLNLLLLRRNLSIRLPLLVLVVLHRVADCETTYPADGAADSRARPRSSYGSTDDGAGCGTDAATYKGALFTSRKRLA